MNPDPSHAFMFGAFLTLSNARGYGQAGPLPIPIGEISALAEFMHIKSDAQRDRLLRVVQALDRAYLEHSRGRT